MSYEFSYAIVCASRRTKLGSLSGGMPKKDRDDLKVKVNIQNPIPTSLSQHIQWRCRDTADREIFMLKIIRIKNFCVNKSSQFRSIHEIFLTVNGNSMNEHLESSSVQSTTR